DVTIEEIASGAVLNLDNPYIRVKSDFAYQPCFDIGVRRRFAAAEHSREHAIGGLCLIKGGLRRRSIQCGSAVETANLNKDRTGLVGATPAHRREYAFRVAAAQIGRHPNTGFQPHRL